MHFQKLTLLTITMAVATIAAPQNQQIPANQQQQQAAASAPVAQSRDAPVYQDAGYSGGFPSGGGGAANYAAPQAGYGAPQAAYGAPAQQQQGNYAQPVETMDIITTTTQSRSRRQITMRNLRMLTPRPILMGLTPSESSPCLPSPD